MNKIKEFFKSIYRKLVEIDGSPQRVALGFGMGVFLGIFPGTGPVAALALAVLFRLNKAAALLGSVITNTWISIIAFAFSIKVGAWIFGLQWEDIQGKFNALMKNFSWNTLGDPAVLEILKPIAVGFVVVGIIFGIIGYFCALLLLKLRKKAPG